MNENLINTTNLVEETTDVTTDLVEETVCEQAKGGNFGKVAKGLVIAGALTAGGVLLYKKVIKPKLQERKRRKESLTGEVVTEG